MGRLETMAGTQGSDLSLPYWSAQDRLGSVVSITDGSGGMIVLNTYDEYGRPGYGNGGRLMYTGQMWLPDWGIYHYKGRQYRPDLGRFLQTDPIGYAAGMNLYGYVAGDPVNMTDPWGLVEEPTTVGDAFVTGTRCEWWNTVCNSFGLDWLLRGLDWNLGGHGGGGGSGGVAPPAGDYRQPECPAGRRDRNVGKRWRVRNGYYGSEAGTTVVGVGGFSFNVTSWARVENGRITEAFSTWSFSALVGLHYGAGSALIRTDSDPRGRSVVANAETLGPTFRHGWGEGDSGQSWTYGVGGGVGPGGISWGGSVIRPLGCATTIGGNNE